MKNSGFIIAIIIFSILFTCGIILVLSSLNLGNYYAREYFEGGGGWTLSPGKANFQAIPFMIVGALLSFLSGIGIISLSVNKISNVRN